MRNISLCIGMTTSHAGKNLTPTTIGAAFCVNEACANFTPEEKRGGFRRRADSQEGTPAQAAPAAKKTAAKKTTTKAATAKKSTAKTTTAKKPAAKTTAKKSTAKTATTKKTAAKKAGES